jgi:hypothetical protein
MEMITLFDPKAAASARRKSVKACVGYETADWHFVVGGVLFGVEVWQWRFGSGGLAVEVCSELGNGVMEALETHEAWCHFMVGGSEGSVVGFEIWFVIW